MIFCGLLPTVFTDCKFVPLRRWRPWLSPWATLAQAHSVSWRRTVNSVKVVGAPSRSCAEHSEALVFIVSRAGQSGRSRDSRVVWAAGQRVDQTELLRAARRQQGPDGLMATAMAGGRARVTR